MKSKVLNVLFVALILFFAASCAQETVQETEYSSIIDKFETPDVDAKPMARMWFTDGGAGASEEGLAQVAKQINKMAEGGFGGVEIAFLSDGSKFGNEDAKTIGWGSENWKNVLKEILKTANAVEDGFKIDITITTHWPPTIGDIDPNDDVASKEASYAYNKITSEDIAAGKVTVPLPEQKTEDYFVPFMSVDGEGAPFLFVDKYVSATIAKVASFDADGNPVFEFASLEDASAYTSKIEGAGYAAGVPDKVYCDANGISYKEVIEKLGPEPATAEFEGKIDADGNRKRMADWQYIYETDLSSVSSLTASAGSDLQVGDYVIFGNYYRGTGQIVSGGGSVPVYNRCYATDYFSDIAVQEIFNFWNKYLLDDEMLALLKENGGKNGTSIFEDSIEIHKVGPAWTYDMLDEFKEFIGYDGTKYAPLFTMGTVASFDNEEEATRVLEDYNLTMGNLYSTEHAAVISEWAKTFNYTYRAQGYPLTGLDISGAALALDVPEGDNATAGDGVRQLASAVNMRGSKMMSMESTTFSANIFSQWVDVAKELNADFSHGINRSILHGSAYGRTFNGYGSAWPGWNFWKDMLNGGGFSSWNHRQIYWDDVETASGYMARTQAVMQNGQAKIDLAVLLDTDASFNNQSGNSLQEVLDNGFSYSIMSEPVLKLDKAYVEGSILAPEGPGYKALIVKKAAKMSSTLMDKILTYAKNGLPVIFFDSNITRIYGTNKADNNDEALLAKQSELMALSNVSTASSEAEILDILSKNGVKPAAQYYQSGLETSHRAANEGVYYYFYNKNGKKAGGFGMPPGATVEEEGEKITNIVTTVTLDGEGTPYLLDAWTGSVTPIAEYIAENGQITMDIALDACEAAIVCIASDTEAFTAAPTYVLAKSGGEVIYDGATLVQRAEAAGTYSVTLNDNSEKTISVEAVPAAISLTEGFDLSLESWGPTEKGAKLSIDNNYGYDVDPTVSDKKTISFEGISLGTWTDLPATKAQLKELGVSKMEKVSGIGVYTTSFELPAEWTSEMGAYMEFVHNSDMIVEVTINGTLIDDINQFSNTTDVGNYLQSGTNTVKIKLDTTLQNRASTMGPTTYGLTEVKLIPYVETVL